MANELEPFTYENIRNAKRRLHALRFRGKTLQSSLELKRQLATMIEGYKEWRAQARKQDKKSHRQALNKVYVFKRRKNRETRKESVPDQSC